MELSKKQRKKVYEEALKNHRLIDDDDRVFMCLFIDSIGQQIFGKVCYDYHEFNLFAPPGRLWFESWFRPDTGFTQDYFSKEVKEVQRIILEFCIAMCEEDEL
jgi:hypothetical protein